MTTHTYSVETQAKEDFSGDYPSFAKIHLDDRMARTIVRLSIQAQASDIWRMEMPFRGADFFEDEFPNGEEENPSDVDLLYLSVTDSDFWVEAEDRNSGASFQTPEISVSDLVRDFGLKEYLRQCRQELCATKPALLAIAREVFRFSGQCLNNEADHLHRLVTGIETSLRDGSDVFSTDILGFMNEAAGIETDGDEEGKMRQEIVHHAEDVLIAIESARAAQSVRERLASDKQCDEAPAHAAHPRPR